MVRRFVRRDVEPLTSNCLLCSSVGNFQQYNATYGGIIVTECTGVMRLFGPGNSAKLAFRGKLPQANAGVAATNRLT